MSKSWIEKFLCFSLPLFISANEEVESSRSSMASVQKDRSTPNRLARLLKKRKEILEALEGDQVQQVRDNRLDKLLKNRKKILLALEGENGDYAQNQIADVLEKEQRKRGAVSQVPLSVRNSKGFELSESKGPDFATVYKALTQGKMVITPEQRKRAQGLLAKKISLPALKEKFEKIEQVLADLEPKKGNSLKTIEVTEEMLVCLVFREFVQAIPRRVLKSALSDPQLLSFVDEQFKIFLKECNKRFAKYHIQIKDEGGFKAFIEKWKLTLSDTEKLQGIGLSYELSEISQSPACLYLSLESDTIPSSGALWSLSSDNGLSEITLSQYDDVDSAYLNSVHPFSQRNVLGSFEQQSLQGAKRMLEDFPKANMEKGVNAAEFIQTYEIPVGSNFVLPGYKSFGSLSDSWYVADSVEESIEKVPEEATVSVKLVQMDKGHIPAPVSRQFFNPRNIRFLQMIERNLEACDRLKKLESLYVSRRLMKKYPYSAATLCAVPLLTYQKRIQRVPYVPQQEEVLENNQNLDVAQQEMSISPSQLVGKRISYSLNPTIEKSSAFDLLSSFLRKSLAGPDQIFPDLEGLQMKQALKLFLSDEFGENQRIGLSSYRDLQAGSFPVWNHSCLGLFDGFEVEEEKISFSDPAYQKQGKEWKQEVPSSYQSSLKLTLFTNDDREQSNRRKRNHSLEGPLDGQLNLVSLSEQDLEEQKPGLKTSDLKDSLSGNKTDKPLFDPYEVVASKSFLLNIKGGQAEGLVRLRQEGASEDFIHQQESYLLSLAERLFSQNPSSLDKVAKNQNIVLEKSLMEKAEKIPEGFDASNLSVVVQPDAQSNISVADFPLSISSAWSFTKGSLAETPSISSDVNSFAFICPVAFTEQHTQDFFRSKTAIQKAHLDRSDSGYDVEYQSVPVGALYAVEWAANCASKHIAENEKTRMKNLEKNLTYTKTIEQIVPSAGFQSGSLKHLPHLELSLTRNHVVLNREENGNKDFLMISLVNDLFSADGENSGKQKEPFLLRLEGSYPTEVKGSRLHTEGTVQDPSLEISNPSIFLIPLESEASEQNGPVSRKETLLSNGTRIEGQIVSHTRGLNNVSSPKGLAFIASQESSISTPSSVRSSIKAKETSFSSVEWEGQSEQEVQESCVMDCF